MTLPIALRPRALSDLSAIWDYTVATWSAGQGHSFLAGLNAVFDLLADHPDIARLRTEFTPPVRIYPYRKHVVIHQSDAAVLDVLRNVHARVNWFALLHH